uniref:Isopenicillin N synthase-like Fe(2+) 2OG dioxygenase domain-containing protein n=1 Tax=Trypanosoma congolense (strain IL3000) TaxID=1068625 RepID=G0UTS0_TRYCI|nr:conserved hypothetical protein [Trypanosoma congolense IL3000]
MLASISFCKLFTEGEVAAAYAALREPQFFDNPPSFLRVSRRRDGHASGTCKVELSASLQQIWTVSQHQMPPPVTHVCRGLEVAVMDFAHSMLRQAFVHRCARDELLNDIGRRSVMRMWRYDAGVGCRPHCDPGVCTALLQATAQGLELSASPKAKHGWRSTEILSGADWVVPQPCMAADDTLVMAGVTAELVSGGRIPAVLHRVRSDWAEHEELKRYSIVVELRPSGARRWFELKWP